MTELADDLLSALRSSEQQAKIRRSGRLHSGNGRTGSLLLSGRFIRLTPRSAAAVTKRKGLSIDAASPLTRSIRSSGVVGGVKGL